MWVPLEEVDPVILHAPTRKSLAFFGAVRPSDGLLVTQRADKFNAETFQRFLSKLQLHILILEARNFQVLLW